mmetsp:Transcript_103775/g.170812  ORF Transcript_103775/g.170812 Transcript_103775/m.170812 type:complete len:224 (-) Transcript_103775:207-878(-)
MAESLTICVRSSCGSPELCSTAQHWPPTPPETCRERAPSTMLMYRARYVPSSSTVGTQTEACADDGGGPEDATAGAGAGAEAAAGSSTSGSCAGAASTPVARLCSCWANSVGITSGNGAPVRRLAANAMAPANWAREGRPEAALTPTSFVMWTSSLSGNSELATTSHSWPFFAAASMPPCSTMASYRSRYFASSSAGIVAGMLYSPLLPSSVDDGLAGRLTEA